MPIVPEFNDEKRLKVLNALFKKGTIKPNIPFIAQKTGLGPSEVKKTIRAMEEEFGIDSYYPTLSREHAGFNILAWTFLQLDLSKKDSFAALLAFLEKEPNIITVHRIIGSGKWNLAIRAVCRDLTEFDSLMNEKIAAKTPCMNELVLDKEYIFLKGQKFKNTGSGIAIIKGQVSRDSKEKKCGEGGKAVILDCISYGECLKPNIRQISRLTGLHATTVKASVNYFLSNKIIKYFSPQINSDKIKRKYLVFDFFKIDFSDKERIGLLEGAVKSDPNLAQARSIFGDPNHNLLFKQVYDSVENYLKGFEETYLQNKELEDFLRQRETFFTTAVYFEQKGEWPTMSRAILRTLIRDSGKEIK